jgi:hypothetical protein
MFHKIPPESGSQSLTTPGTSIRPSLIILLKENVIMPMVILVTAELLYIYAWLPLCTLELAMESAN